MSASPSLVTDLSWLLSVAARPPCRPGIPKLAEMFKGREDLADRVRTFWDDGSEEMCFSEMQVLAQHGGASCATDPEASCGPAIEAAVATVPLDLAMPSESPEEREIFLDRFRRLRESPDAPAVVPRPPRRGLGARRRRCGNRRCRSWRRPGATSWRSTSEVGHWSH